MQDLGHRLLSEVRNNVGITPEELAARLGMSTRTLRTHVRRLNGSLKGAQIILRYSKGYELEVSDPELFASWEASASSTQVERLPANRGERVDYLLNDLLQRSDWVTLEDLSAVLAVSRATVSQSLRDVEEALSRFDLALERRPHYGIRVSGSEINRRLCLAGLAVSELAPLEDERQRSGSAEDSLDEVRSRLARIDSYVDAVLRSEDFRMSTLAYQNLLIHISIAITRIKAGCYVPVSAELNAIAEGTRAYQVAGRIASGIGELFSVELPEEEVAYIAVHLAGKELFGPAADSAASGEDGPALVIPEEVWEVTGRMLQRVWESFRFDFRDDLELRMNLARHIVPLKVRLAYRMELQNPLLADTRHRFPLAYSMALESASVFVEAWGTVPSEDEVGYLALSFALALERKTGERPKKNVLVVCASGAGSARLLEYRCRREFGDYVDRIQTCDVNDVKYVDFSEIDYVFTTVPLHDPVPVPVREVRHFFDEADVRAMREIFQASDLAREQSDALPFFGEDLFFPHFEARTKADVIDGLCALVAAARQVSPDLRELVWRREGAAPTSFGNRVAFPHPLEAATERAFMAVALLDHGIDWDGQEVRAIFMLVPSRDSDPRLKTFHSVVAELLTSKDAIDALLRDQTWECLRTQILEAEKVQSG